MSAGRMLLLAAMALVFLAWAALMFRTLFALRRRAAARTGRALPGPRATLAEWGRWLRAPEDRAVRRWLGATTLALVIWIMLQAATAG